MAGANEGCTFRGDFFACKVLVPFRVGFKAKRKSPAREAEKAGAPTLLLEEPTKQAPVSGAFCSRIARAVGTIPNPSLRGPGVEKRIGL